MGEIGSFSVLLFLFMFTYTLLGMELFAHKVKFDSSGEIDVDNGTSPRANFDDFLHGITTVYIVLIGDDWQIVMYNHI